jgi:hypothetical protein
MPTPKHNGLVEMFRDNPDLAPHLLATLFGLAFPPYATVGVVESSLDQMAPVELRADLVLELRDASGVLVLAIVLEVQRDDDPDRKYAWPVHVTIVRAKKRCPTILVVVTPDAEVATRSGQPIDLGLGRGSIQPLVLGLAVQRALEALVKERQSGSKATFPPFMQRLIDSSWLKAFCEGWLVGYREGRLGGVRSALLRLVARAEISLTDDDRARIHACADPETLGRWVENVLGAKSAADVFC